MDKKRKKHYFNIYEFIYLNNTLKYTYFYFLGVLGVKKSILKYMVEAVVRFLNYKIAIVDNNICPKK